MLNGNELICSDILGATFVHEYEATFGIESQGDRIIKKEARDKRS